MTDLKGILGKVGKQIYDPDKAKGNAPLSKPAPGNRIFTRPPGVPQPPNKTVVTPRPVRPSTLTSTQAVDQEYFQNIMDAIGQGPQLPEGFDQFIRMLIALEDTAPNLDLKQRFEVAYATINSTTGLTREAIIKALENQRAAVEQIHDDFIKGTEQNASAQKAENANRLKELANQKLQLETDIEVLTKKLEKVMSDLAVEQNADRDIDDLLADNQAAFNETMKAVYNGYPSQTWFGIDVLLDIARPKQ